MVRCWKRCGPRKRAIGQQAAVIGERQDGQRIRAVVGDGEKPGARIEGEMHRIVAAGRLAVQHGELAAFRIDHERRRLAAIAVHGIKPRALGVDGEEGRVLQTAEMLEMGEPSGATVDLVDIDAVTLASALGRGVAADEGEEGTGVPGMGRVWPAPAGTTIRPRREGLLT
jgi:hypothetical protein